MALAREAGCHVDVDAGQPVARAREATLNAMNLVLLSVLLTVTISDVAGSYENDN